MGCLRCFTKVKFFHVKILLLDKQELIQEIQEKTTGQDLLDNVFKYLNLIETAYFGLRYQDNSNQTHWLEPAKRVSHQIRGVAPITLYMGVKFYAADPCRLVEEITRYQFVLQIKSDILQGRLPLSLDLSIELAALALQSELGDYDPSRHSHGYASEFRFVSNQSEDLEAEIESAHRKMNGLRPADAEMTYLEKVKWLDMYGVDLHPVIGEDNIEYFLGLTPSGIIILRNRDKVGNYFWPRITKIYFKGIYFMLRVRDKNNDENTYGFETPSRQACKHLWKCCVEHHAFFRLVQVSPSGLFSLGSRFRYSGRTEKEVIQQVNSIRRPPPQFIRRPSKRYSRRSNPELSSESRIYHHRQSSSQNTPNRAEYSKGHSTPEEGANFSPSGISVSGDARSYVNSLPRISRNERLLNKDLSLQSLQWLETRGLYGNQRERRNSVPDQNLLYQHFSQRPRPRKSTSVSSCHGGQSDNESDASGVSWNSKSRHRHESGSESGSRRRGRRKRQGSYKLIDSEDQRQPPLGHQSLKTAYAKSVNSGNALIQEATVVRRSGYVNSGGETETETIANISARKNRRRQRSRSRSPGESRNRLPQELIKHLEFNLVEPNSDSMKGEIPFTNVETSRSIQAMGRSRCYDSREKGNRHQINLAVIHSRSGAASVMNAKKEEEEGGFLMTKKDNLAPSWLLSSSNSTPAGKPGQPHNSKKNQFSRIDENTSSPNGRQMFHYSPSYRDENNPTQRYPLKPRYNLPSTPLTQDGEASSAAKKGRPPLSSSLLHGSHSNKKHFKQGGDEMSTEL